MSLIASGLGGYVAGRLRTKWTAWHGDEVFFRDTVHGFLAWSIAVIVLVWLSASMAAAVVRGGAQAGAAVAQGVGSTVTNVASSAGDMASSVEGSEAGQEIQDTLAYYLDRLFRSEGAQQGGQQQQGNEAQGAEAGQEVSLPPLEEVARIVRRALADGELNQEDTQYVSRLIAENTGLSAQEAEERLQQTFSDIQMQVQQVQDTAAEAAETAREATAYASLWALVTMLIGAFSASLAATFGGKQRDSLD